MSDRETQAPTIHLGRPSKNQANDLAQLVLHTVRRGDDNVREEFVDYQYFQRLNHCESRSTWWGRAHAITNLLLVSLGLSSSAVLALAGQGGATPTWARDLAILFGLLVGVLAGFNRIVRPGELALRYYRAETELRNEGWNLVNHTGPYANLQGDLYPQFAKNVVRISRRHAVAPVMGDASRADGFTAQAEEGSGLTSANRREG